MYNVNIPATFASPAVGPEVAQTMMTLGLLGCVTRKPDDSGTPWHLAPGEKQYGSGSVV